MRLTQLSRPRNFPLGLIAAGLLAVLLASPAGAEPHATTPDADLDLSAPSALAGPQDALAISNARTF